MTRYTLRALAAQWRIWSATVAVLALAAVLVDVCLTHRFAVTRPEVVAAARAVGVGPAELEASGTSIYVYSAFTAIPVVAIVGRSCVQANLQVFSCLPSKRIRSPLSCLKTPSC